MKGAVKYVVFSELQYTGSSDKLKTAKKVWMALGVLGLLYP